MESKDLFGGFLSLHHSIFEIPYSIPVLFTMSELSESNGARSKDSIFLFRVIASGLSADLCHEALCEGVSLGEGGSEAISIKL